MKLVIFLFLLFLSGCTISDKYYKPYVGINNVGTSAGNIETKETLRGNTYPVFTRYSDFCWYLFGLFKMSNKCSPDNIAHQNKIGQLQKSILNGRYSHLLLFSVQRLLEYQQTTSISKSNNTDCSFVWTVCPWAVI